MLRGKDARTTSGGGSVRQLHVACREARAEAPRSDVRSSPPTGGGLALAERILLLDVKLAREARRADVVARYGPLVAALRARRWEVSLDTFAIGSRGGWNGHDWRVLRAMGVAARAHRRLAAHLVASTVHWSRNAWAEHSTGAPQLVLTSVIFFCFSADT